MCISSNLSLKVSITLLIDRHIFRKSFFVVPHIFHFLGYQNAIPAIFTVLLILLSVFYIVGKKGIKSISTMQIKSNQQNVNCKMEYLRI